MSTKPHMHPLSSVAVTTSQLISSSMHKTSRTHRCGQQACQMQPMPVACSGPVLISAEWSMLSAKWIGFDDADDADSDATLTRSCATCTAPGVSLMTRRSYAIRYVIHSLNVTKGAPPSTKLAEPGFLTHVKTLNPKPQP